ncbi:MAG: LuxR C-terminal-related transcriptional regulator [Lachnospiraceae bacterium]|jgi:DNA-binding CsgD family transcriptional regulator
MYKMLESLNKMAISIFEAYDFNSLGEAVMTQLPDLIRHSKSFFTFSAIGSRRRRTHIRSLTIPEAIQKEYLDKYEETDYTTWYLNQKDIHVYRDSDIISSELMEKTDIFRNWISPMGMYYLCGNVVRNETSGVRYGELTILRAKNDGDYTDEELRIFGLVTDLMRAWCDKHYGEAYNSVRIDSPVSPSENKESSLDDPFVSLTMREKDVAKLICSGMETHEIGEHLSISYGTTRRHIANIYSKIGVSSRIQLINKLGKL